MNKYLLAVIIGAFLAVLGWGQAQNIRANKYRSKLAQEEAASITLAQKAREGELLTKTNEELAARIRSMEARKKPLQAPGSPVTGGVAIPLAKGQVAPAEGILVQKDWVAKSLACLEFRDTWEGTLAETLRREKECADKTDSLRASRKFWRTTAVILAVGAGSYIYLRK